MTNTKKVTPCGMLYSQGREYFLLSPYPVVKDWEGDNAYRFVVVPRTEIWDNTISTKPYPHARHIVTNAFVVDYTELPEIEIKVLPEYDLQDIPDMPEDTDGIITRGHYHQMEMKGFENG